MVGIVLYGHLIYLVLLPRYRRMHLNAIVGILEGTGQGNIYGAIGIERNDLLRECATPEVTPGGLAQ
jgi:hypothetical protein